MIFTIGYQRLTLGDLQHIVTGLDATLIDVRGKPVSRKAAFNRGNLERAFGPRYQWHGDTLAGPWHGGTKPEGLRKAAKWATSKEPFLLMCMEHDPEECHRYQTICAELLPTETLHIYGEHVIPASELMRCAEELDEEYWYEDLAKYLR